MKKYLIALMAATLVAGCKKESAVVGTSAAGDGTFILAVKGEAMPVGKIIERDKKMELTDGEMTVNLQGKEMKGTTSITETHQEKVETLENGKYRYSIIADSKKQSTTMAGQVQDKPEEISPLVGQMVVAEKGDDGVWTAKLESGEATAEMAPGLEKIAKNLNEDLDFRIYGTEPRKVGDTWKVEGPDLMGMKGGAGTFNVKFEGIEDFQGVRCAKITGDIEITGTPDAENASGMKMTMKGDFVIFRSIKDRVDMQNTLTGTMEAKGDLEPQPGMTMRMEMLGNMVLKSGAKVSGLP